MLAAVHINDPQMRAPPVLHHVHEIAHVHDLLAVGRHLRIGGELEVKNIHQTETIPGRLLGNG